MTFDSEAARANVQRLEAVWIGLTNEKRDALLVVANAIAAIGPTGLEILTLLAERLAMGAATYKADFDDDRDMLAEIIPEHADGLVYLLAHSIRMKKNSDKAKARTNARA